MNLDFFANNGAINGALAALRCNLEPPLDVLPSQWAERNVRIPAGNAVPGLLRLANAPYQREPMDMLVDPDCYRISLKWGAQVGKTTMALCQQSFCIEQQPRSQMMMQPSQGDLATWLETKFNPLVEANASIRNRIAKPRGRNGVNNRQMKSYPGGFLMFAWSGSTKTMRGRSAPLIVCDEVDGYEVTEEGHPVGLLWQRAATFGDQRFLVEISTPTIKGSSYIDSAYEAGDKRRFFVCCPDCGHEQTLAWSRIFWEGRRSTGIDDADLDRADGVEHAPETAVVVCEACGSHWDDGRRINAIRSAEGQGAGWRAEKPFKGHASYHINELYSILRRLRDIVQSYLDKLATDDLQTFVNVSLAETWEEQGEQADATGLQARCRKFAAQAPHGVVYITAGIDMQPDRLEVEIVGWGLGEESWSIDYRVLWGDPDQQDVWDDLDELLAETFEHESGAILPISAACLDTGGTGGNTQAAYEYARGKTGRRLFAIKGGGTWGAPVVSSPSRRQSGKNARKVDLFMVGVDEAKLIVMRRLNVVRPGPGYCHFPAGRGEEYFSGLTAERLVTKYVKGFPVRKWYKQDKARNEPLDCRVYALAALKIMAPNLKRLAQRMGAPVKAREPDPALPDVPERAAEAAPAPVLVPPQKKETPGRSPAATTPPAPPPKPYREIPQEEPPDPPRHPGGKRKFKGGQGGRNWARRW